MPNTMISTRSGSARTRRRSASISAAPSSGSLVPQHWILTRYLPIFLEGALVTVELALSTIAIVIVWGLVVAAARLSRWRGLAMLAGGYIQLMRNTPLLVQIYFIYFGFAMAGFALSGFGSGLLALCLQNGAYVAEIYRGGLQSLS